MTGPTWQEVALSALNVAQTVLLAWVATMTSRNRESIRQIERQSARRRRGDHHQSAPPEAD